MSQLTVAWNSPVQFRHVSPFNILPRKKVFYHSVFDLFPLTYMCIDSDFPLFNDLKAENIPLRLEIKIYIVIIKKNS